MKKAIAVAIISTLMVVLSLYAVNAIIVEQQKNRQREISHTLLSYSEELTQNIASTLKNTTVQGCDSASLNVYRKLKMRSLYFADVGFIEKGKITCTAFWGKLANPIALPLSCIKPRTDSVWRSFRRKISLSVMRQFITTLLFSPPVQPTINLPPLPPTIRFVLPLKISAAPFSPLRRHQKTSAAYSLCYLRWL